MKSKEFMITVEGNGRVMSLEFDGPQTKEFIEQQFSLMLQALKNEGKMKIFKEKPND